jgi:crotonobetainyl-CoA:carnitine CoA-transferase CaiB-like acyl-CoA transferase
MFLGDADLAGRPEFSTNTARSEHRAELSALIADRFAALTADEATGALEDAAIAYATVNSMHDVWAHPQLAARERWHQVGTPAGPVPALAPPGHGSTGPRMDPVPAVGEHTRRIVSALGYSPEEIDSLEADGVV